MELIRLWPILGLGLAYSTPELPHYGVLKSSRLAPDPCRSVSISQNNKVYETSKLD